MRIADSAGSSFAGSATLTAECSDSCCLQLLFDYCLRFSTGSYSAGADPSAFGSTSPQCLQLALSD